MLVTASPGHLYTTLVPIKAVAEVLLAVPVLFTCLTSYFWACPIVQVILAPPSTLLCCPAVPVSADCSTLCGPV